VEIKKTKQRTRTEQ